MPYTRVQAALLDMDLHGLPPAVRGMGTPGLERLAGLCWWLQVAAGGVAFGLSEREAAPALGVNRKTAAKYIKHLVASGFIRLVVTGHQRVVAGPVRVAGKTMIGGLKRLTSEYVCPLAMGTCDEGTSEQGTETA